MGGGKEVTLLPRLRWPYLVLLAVLAAVALPGATSVTALAEVTIARLAVLEAPEAPDVGVERAPAAQPTAARASGRLGGVALREGGDPSFIVGLEPATGLPAAGLAAALEASAALTVPEPLPLLPSVFERAQVVSFYGYPGLPVMGALGAYAPLDAVAAVSEVAAEYDALNGRREVVPALHLIVAVAQRYSGSDGLYLDRMDADLLAEYVEAAREREVLLFLDIQVGWSDVLFEVGWLAEALREPFVHLAIDPEFATLSRGAPPGVAIGSLAASEVNAVQVYLARMVRALGLPPKVLVLHQFLDGMLLDVEAYQALPEVELAIDMDGYGGDQAKLSKYDRYSLAGYSERAAIKLFYDWDAPLITPARLQALEHPPDLIIYQ